MSQALRHGAPDRLRAAYPAEPDALIAYVRQRFADELEPHFRLEEIELVPRCRDQPEPLAAHALRVEREHHQLRTMLADLRSGPTLTDALDAFAHLLEAHVRFEERSWFPCIEEALSPSTLEAIASRLTPSDDLGRPR